MLTLKVRIRAGCGIPDAVKEYAARAQEYFTREFTALIEVEIGRDYNGSGAPEFVDCKAFKPLWRAAAR
jgi:hypothetical protein